MARDKTAHKKAGRIRSAADPILVDGERITGFGQCWAAQLSNKTPLLFRGRRQYLMALTDRRLLIFDRKRKPAARDLVLGKRYEAFTLQRVRRRRPLLQVLVGSANGMRMAFEFRPGQRDVGGELVARLTPKNGRAPAAPPPADAPAPAPVPDTTQPDLPAAAAPAAPDVAAPDAPRPAPPPRPPEPAAPEPAPAPSTASRDPDANVNLAERLGLDPATAAEPPPAPAPPPARPADPAPVSDAEQDESDAFWRR